MTQDGRQPPIEIAPSILSADFSRVGEQVRDVLEGGARRIHVDVMDGMFVPNITVGPRMVQCLRPLARSYGAIVEVHLMIVQPERYIADFTAAGADLVIVHVETCPHLNGTIQHIRQLGAKPGVTLNPATPLVTLEEVLADVEHVLVMTVNPGFGNQELIPATLEKVSRLRETLDRRDLQQVDIEVDGGVHRETIAAVARAGANVAVAGSAVFNDEAPPGVNLQSLYAAVR